MTDSGDFDASFVVNLHREGALCRASLDSAKLAIAKAEKSGFRVELLLILDRPDELTRSAVDVADCEARIVTVDLGDLAEARNCAIHAARGRHIAFMDGDDLCCENWLMRALAEAEKQVNRFIVHPQFNLFFGRDYDRYFWIHPDMRNDDITLSRMLVENLWTASVLARRDTFLEFPYRRNRLADGYGYEDWVWNLETALAGIMHITAVDTVLFIRRNKRGSLLDASSAMGVVPDIRAKFGSGIISNIKLDGALGKREPVRR